MINNILKGIYTLILIGVICCLLKIIAYKIIHAPLLIIGWIIVMTFFIGLVDGGNN